MVITYGGERYPGVVTQMIQRETEVDCMNRSGQYWKWPADWPEKKDLWYSPQNILQKILPPVPVSARDHVKFTDL